MARQLKIGIAGIGVGATEILPAMESMPELDLFAGADLVAETRDLFQKRFEGVKAYDSVEKLCQDPDIEAVWVATPNRFHAEHAIMAAEHGKHVVVEKPMALSLEQAERMLEAADKHGVKLLAGHTQSFSLPVRTMRKVIVSGQLGPVRAIHVQAYSDWMLRPRTADELDLSQGGGVPYRQVPHQADTIRLLGGGELRSVRAMTGQWLSARPIPGYYCAYLEFEDGTPATMIHNGYGYLLGNSMVAWGADKQEYTLEQRVEVRKSLRSGTRDEPRDKQDMRLGGRRQDAVLRRTEPGPWLPSDLGVLVVTCERGDMRHSAHGVLVYDDEGMHEIDLRVQGQKIGRRAELEELYNGVVLGQPIFHDGRWGMATLEVSLAIMQSARERREIMLSHQVAVPVDYDADLAI
ncbi:MAG TPA: Gfo/Idh/MocA family oxidoreductase [Chloroflexota bacterium]|nr:Gfo/Idh/MocA family oxidoreductase [Chloroflexota bacterium]